MYFLFLFGGQNFFGKENLGNKEKEKIRVIMK